MKLVLFPPYGALPLGFAEQAVRPEAPTDFAPGAVGSGGDWLRVIDRVERIINRYLWPSWDREACAWRSPDVAQMNAVTQADFSVLAEFLNSRWLLEQGPESSTPNPPRHMDFFIDEDEGRPGQRLAAYSDDIRMSPAELPSLWADIFRRKIGHTAMLLKSRLQRPRPHQVALLGKRDGFQWHLAATAHSPSMCSGHALQGLMFAAAIFESLSAMDALTPAARAGLAQFGVDVGDRRVFAGVHYPSDNVASWIAAGSVGRRVFKPDTIAFMRFAVGRSEVYRRLVAAQVRHPVLKPALLEVDKALLQGAP